LNLSGAIRIFMMTCQAVVGQTHRLPLCHSERSRGISR
jgi:hypothetical protein